MNHTAVNFHEFVEKFLLSTDRRRENYMIERRTATAYHYEKRTTLARDADPSYLDHIRSMRSDQLSSAVAR